MAVVIAAGKVYIYLFIVLQIPYKLKTLEIIPLLIVGMFPSEATSFHFSFVHTNGEGVRYK